ncbi:MAG: hypothetical protein EBX52_05785, partial [Proteobacteria bacterium]|nr:hypothetical protein [Pseudomonadota bacterium]
AFSTEDECQNAFPSGCVLRTYSDHGTPRICYAHDGVSYSGPGSVSFTVPSGGGGSGTFSTGTSNSQTVTIQNTSSQVGRNCQVFATNPTVFSVTPAFVSMFQPGVAGQRTFSIQVVPFSGATRISHVEVLCENGYYVTTGIYSAEYLTLYRTFKASANKHMTSQYAAGEGAYLPDIPLGRPFTSIPSGASASDYKQICRCQRNDGISFTTTDATCPGASGSLTYTRECFSFHSNPVYAHTVQGTGEIPLYRMNAPLRDGDYMDAIDNTDGVTGFFQIKNSADNECLDVEQANTADGTKIIKYSCNPGPTDNQLWKFTPRSGGYKLVTKLLPTKVIDVLSNNSILSSIIGIWTDGNGTSQSWSMSGTLGQFQLNSGVGGCLDSHLYYCTYASWWDEVWGNCTDNWRVGRTTCDSGNNYQSFYAVPEAYTQDAIIGYIQPP